VIKQQIGREPRGVLEVKTTCRWGYPQVIVNRPVSALTSDLEVFPTMYWLTCPYLCREIAALESAGVIAQFEERIAQDPEFAEAMAESHATYAKERLALIPKDVQKRLEQEYPERYQVLARSGVGGIRSPQGVKCLHTHAADYLARGTNAIGAETLEMLGKPWFCPEAECREYDR
jgi:hypothetical protein